LFFEPLGASGEDAMFDLSNPFEIGLDIVLLAIGLVVGLLAGLFARFNVFYGLNFVLGTFVGGIGGLFIGRLLVAAGLGKVNSIDPSIYIAGILGAAILLFVVGFLHDKATAKASA
jgi:uncharacterized membrane protein YeaQ/YmgE (transglycosylase-associated protein family)